MFLQRLILALFAILLICAVDVECRRHSHDSSQRRGGRRGGFDRRDRSRERGGSFGRGGGRGFDRGPPGRGGFGRFRG
ncbi:unnamed protein product [Cylicocyclus nassatus]|uniref:Uncharacterized protein n=1 Tax=Cylicocyclus nassatus TaxID=53992 RepID=A0AA36GFI1_CYLNA|nr:unnamed protein product [Cylicocyclus nassatus]